MVSAVQRRMELQKAMAFTLIASLFSCRIMKACIPAGRDVPACCRLVVVEIRGKEGKKEAKQGMPIDRFQVSSEGGSQQTFACLSSFLTPQTSLYCKGTIRARKRGEAEGGGSATSSFPCPLIEVSLESEEAAAAAAAAATAAASLDINDHSLPTKPPEEAEERGS